MTARTENNVTMQLIFGLRFPFYFRYAFHVYRVTFISSMCLLQISSGEISISAFMERLRPETTSPIDSATMVFCLCSE